MNLTNRPLLSRGLAYRAALALFVLILAAPTPSALAQQPDHDDHGEEQGHEDEGHEEIVSLSADEMREFGIVVSVAGSATLTSSVDLPGEIQPNDNTLAHIVPRFPGIVTDVRAQVGDRVEAGQVLAVIESDESLSPYEVKTVLAGTITAKHITLGEAVSREHAAFVVADLGTVWADITVYQRDLGHVAVGQEVRISAGNAHPPVTGAISYVAPVVDEETRTALARVVLPNPGGAWRPGTFITARILLDSFVVPVAVPRTALQHFEDQDVVFVQTPEGFMPRPVTVGRSDENTLEIVSGLAAGEMYVSQGGFTLKAELGKGSFGGGHAH
jgi:cobalt-zinc-cadmium efflux system membrane fusion protein